MNEVALNEQELGAKVIALVDSSRGVRIVDQESYALMCNNLLAIKACRKALEAEFRPGIKKADDLHKHLLSRLKYHDTPLLLEEIRESTLIAKWREDQERIRRAEEAKLQEMARAQQEELAMQEAVALENIGLHAEAEEVITNPVMTPIVLSSPVPHVAGISDRDNWSAECYDIAKLCLAIAEGRAPVTAVLPNTVFLNQQARSLKQLFNIPGCKAVVKKSIAGRIS